MSLENCFKKLKIDKDVADAYKRGVEAIMKDEGNSFNDETSAAAEYIRQREETLKDNFKSIISQALPNAKIENYLNEEEAPQPQETVQVQSEESETPVAEATKATTTIEEDIEQANEEGRQSRGSSIVTDEDITVVGEEPTPTEEVTAPNLLTNRNDLSKLSIAQLENVARQLKEKAIETRRRKKQGEQVTTDDSLYEADFKSVKEYIASRKQSQEPSKKPTDTKTPKTKESPTTQDSKLTEAISSKDVKSGFTFIRNGKEVEIAPRQKGDPVDKVRTRLVGTDRKGSLVSRNNLVNRINDPDNTNVKVKEEKKTKPKKKEARKKSVKEELEELGKTKKTRTEQLQKYFKLTPKQAEATSSLYNAVARHFDEIGQASRWLTNRIASIGRLSTETAKEAGGKFQIIGENAELSENARYNLELAKVLESKKTAKEIAHITGWERGTDGLWRYEIPDVKIDQEKWKKVKVGEKVPLLSILDDIVGTPIYKAYPDVGRIQVEKLNPVASFLTGTIGWYHPVDNIIGISKNLDNPTSVLLHELQHWVQYKEGFATGGNETTVRDFVKGKPLIDAIDRTKKQFKSSIADKNNFLRIVNKIPETAYNDIFSILEKGKTESSDYVLGTLKHVLNKQFGIPQRSSNHISIDMFSIYEDLDITFNKPATNFNELLIAYKETLEQDKKYIKENLDKLNFSVDRILNDVFIRSFVLDNVAREDLHKIYQSLTGETEARNVQNRARFGITGTGRPISSTEDVARESQIVLRNSIGTSALSLEDVNRITNNLEDHITSLIEKGKTIAEGYIDPKKKKDTLDHVAELEKLRDDIVARRQNTKWQEEDGIYRGTTIGNAKTGMTIAALESPNASTAVHELFHVFEDDLTIEQRQTLIDAYNEANIEGEDVTEFDTDVSEYGARLWENYFANDRKLTKEEVPDTKKRNVLQKLFDNFTEWLTAVAKYVNSVGQEVEIKMTDSVQRLFDTILGIEDTLPPPAIRQTPKKFTERVRDDNSIDPEFKASIEAGDLRGPSIPNVVTNAEADLIISKIPATTINEKIMSRYDIPERVRVLVGQKLVRKLSQQASREPDTAKKKDLYEQAKIALNHTIKIGRDAGRTVQIFRVWKHMTPEGFLFYAQNAVDSMLDSVIEKHKFAIDDMLDAHNRAKKKAIRTFTRQDIIKSQKLKRTVRIKQIRKKALEKIRKGLNNLTTGGLSPEIIEGLVEYGYSLVLSGVNSFTEFGNRLRKAIKGVDLTDDDISTIWNKQYEGRSLKDHADLLNIDLETFLITNYGQKDFTNRLADRLGISRADSKKVVAALTFKIKSTIESEVKKSIPFNARKVKKLAKTLANIDNLTKSDIHRILYRELGFPEDLSDDVKDQIIQRAKNINTAPDNSEVQNENIADVMRYINEVLGDHAPEYTSREQDSVFWGLWYSSVLSGFTTQALNAGANLFKALVENLITATYEVVYRGGDPELLWRAVSPMLNAAKSMFQSGRATKDFSDILFRGKKRRGQSNKFFDESALERRGKEFKNPLALSNLSVNPFTSINNIFNASIDDLAFVAKTVPRFMSAVDAWFYWGHHSARMTQLLNRYHIDEGLRGDELKTAVNNALFGGESVIKSAEIQARNEFKNIRLPNNRPVTKSDIKRRVDEILEQQTKATYGEDMWENAVSYGQKGTFTQKPEGALGHSVVPVIRNLYRNRLFGRGVRLVVPFLNVVANVLNDQLDYTVAGMWRTAGKGMGRELSAEARQRTALKTIGGNLVTLAAAVYLFTMFDPDNEDNIIKIHGSGPTDFGKKLQLLKTNWKEYSLQVGDAFFSFKELPIGVFLGIIGNVFDMARYSDDVSEETLMAMIETGFYEGRKILGTIFDASFLSGIQPFMELVNTVSRGSIDRAGSSLGKWMIQQTRVLQPNIYRQIAKAFDPKMYTSSNWKEHFYKTHYQPTLSLLDAESDLVVMQNALGDEISFSREGAMAKLANLTGLSRFFNIRKGDPVYDMLANKNVLVKPLSIATTMTDANGERQRIYYTDRKKFMAINKTRGKEIKRYIKANLARFNTMKGGEVQKELDNLLESRAKSSITQISKRKHGY